MTPISGNITIIGIEIYHGPSNKYILNIDRIMNITKYIGSIIRPDIIFSFIVSPTKL